MLFDTHAHLNDDKLQPLCEQVIKQAKEAGLIGMVNIGYDRPSSLLAVKQAELYPDYVYAAVGYHPYDADKLDNAACDELIALAQNPRVVAIGEIGLDYYRDFVPKEVQQQGFIRQIELAQQLKLPILIHDRDSHADIMHILKEQRGGINGGIIHCFSGSKEMARFCLDLGFDIAFGGSLTFANARSLPEVCAYVPIENMLLETDCPYLAPQPMRGKLNEPANVAVVAEYIARIKGISIEQVGECTTRNALRVYNIRKA